MRKILDTTHRGAQRRHLRDGYSVSVPLIFRDATRRTREATRDPFGRLISTFEAIEEELDDGSDRLLVTGAAGGGAGLHRPGFRFIADAAGREHNIAAKEAAYRAADEADANAWRGSASRPESAEDHTVDRITADRLSLLDGREARIP